MATPFSYSTNFVLDKDHFNECYEQSMNAPKSNTKAIVFIIIGALLLFLSNSAYLAWFLIALGILELFSNRYHQAWWVLRQMLSRASRSTVTITFDEQGISTKSPYFASQTPWDEFTKIEDTEKGYLLFTKKGKSYLSKKHLSTQAQEFIQQKALAIAE